MGSASSRHQPRSSCAWCPLHRAQLLWPDLLSAEDTAPGPTSSRAPPDPTSSPALSVSMRLLRGQLRRAAGTAVPTPSSPTPQSHRLPHLPSSAVPAGASHLHVTEPRGRVHVLPWFSLSPASNRARPSFSPWPQRELDPLPSLGALTHPSSLVAALSYSLVPVIPIYTHSPGLQSDGSKDHHLSTC